MPLSNKYFREKIYEDSSANIRVEITESGSVAMEDEDFTLRVKTRHEFLEVDVESDDEPKAIARTYGIEHHSEPPHDKPHLQFKFHADEIGKFRIRVDFANVAEYEKGVLGFIYKIKGVLEDLERIKKGVTSDVMVLELVNSLSDEWDFLTKKIQEGLKNYSIDFEEKRGGDITKIKDNKLLIDFLGNANIEIIEYSYNSK